MSPGEVAAIMFGLFAILILLRIPVSFALGLACIPIFLIDPRLTPFLLINEMWKSYNAFILLAVPFFLSKSTPQDSTTTLRLFRFPEDASGGANRYRIHLRATRETDASACTRTVIAPHSHCIADLRKGGITRSH